MMAKCRVTLFVLQKNKPTKQAFWCQRNLHGIVWSSESLDYSELPNILHREVKGEYFAKLPEDARFLANFWVTSWKNWLNMAVPKLHFSLVKRLKIAQVTISDTRSHSTVQSARQNCFVTGHCNV